MKTKALFTAALAAILIAVSGAAPPVQHGTLKAYTFTNMRNMRFGEILVAKKSGVEVYNTTGMNDCPAKVWDAIDPKQLAKQLGALEVIKNGPHFWMMDEQTASFGETATFAGLDARWAATLSLAIAKAQTGGHPYTIFMPKKTQKMVYSKGKPVYELVDPHGNNYVMQAHDEQFPIESLATLGQRMKKLPKGWQYRTRTLTEDLVLDLKPDQTVYAVGDEFNQYYTRPPRAQ
jgi:hypothetical protein